MTMGKVSNNLIVSCIDGGLKLIQLGDYDVIYGLEIAGRNNKLGNKVLVI